MKARTFNCRNITGQASASCWCLLPGTGHTGGGRASDGPHLDLPTTADQDRPAPPGVVARWSPPARHRGYCRRHVRTTRVAADPPPRCGRESGGSRRRSGRPISAWGRHRRSLAWRILSGLLRAPVKAAVKRVQVFLRNTIRIARRGSEE